MENKNKEMIEKVRSEISKIENKENNILFFVIDTKGNPSGSLAYIYKTAYELKENGYNVTMIHQEKEFIGPFEWLGEKYKELDHKNVEEETVDINPSDFLFIPEIYSHVMTQVKDLPCKKIVMFQNFDYLTEFFPLSADFYNLNIDTAVTTSNSQKAYIETCFPGLNVSVVEPSISKMYRNTEEPKKLIVNIVARNQADVNKIVKNFYWRFPAYRWISFRDLRGFSQEEFSDLLREGAITVWVDTDTNFGYSAIEALKSGSIVLGKVPENPVDWMIDGEGLTDSIIWFDNIRNLPNMLSSVIRSWTINEIPAELYGAIGKFDDRFTEEAFKENVKHEYTDGIFERRLKDFSELLKELENNNIDEKVEE